MTPIHWHQGERVTLNHLAVGAACWLATAAGEVVVRVITKGARFVVTVVSTGERLEVGGAKHVRRARPGDVPPAILGWVATTRCDIAKTAEGERVIVSHAGCWELGDVSGAVMRRSDRAARRYVYTPAGARLSVSVDAPAWRAVRAGVCEPAPSQPESPSEPARTRPPRSPLRPLPPEPTAYVYEPPLPAGRADVPWVKRPAPVAPMPAVMMREWWYIERGTRDGDERLVFETEGAARAWKDVHSSLRPVRSLRATALETEPTSDGLVRMKRPEYRGPKTRRRPPVRERKPYKDDDDAEE